MKLHDQRGMIDLVLVVVVLVLAAGLGGYVLYRQHQAQQTYNAAGTGATVTSHPKAKASTQIADQYTGWKAYSKSNISFRYPGSWFAIDQGQDIQSGFSSSVNVSAIDISKFDGTNTSTYQKYIGLNIAEVLQGSLGSSTQRFSKLTASDSIIGSININSTNYKLVGQSVTSKGSSKTSSRVYVEDCKQDGTCSYYLKRSDGTYVTLFVVTQGNPEHDFVPFDLNSADYANIQLVLKSLKF